MQTSLVELRQWFELLRPVWRILLVLLLAWLLLRLLGRALPAFRGRIVRHADGQRDPRRIDTLINVTRYAATVVIVSVAGMLVLGAVGITITPLLATAGVAGIAIGFGAQTLVKDFFTGLFLLLENQVSEGDNIEAAGKAGIVEQVTLRHLRLRDDDGGVHFIPNSMITVVTNRSREYGYALVELSLARSRELEPLFAAMREVGRELRADPALAGVILDDIDIAGVDKLDESGMTLRCRIKVAPAQQWRVRREFLRRMKERLDQA